MTYGGKTMIESISASSMTGFSQRPQWGGDYKINEQQKTQLDEILARYDPENMTEEDMRSMLEEIRAAGIRPGEDLKNSLESAGFELPRPPAGGPPPMPPGDASGVQSQQPQFLLDFIEKLKEGNVTESDIQTFLETLKNQGEELKGFFVNQNS